MMRCCESPTKPTRNIKRFSWTRIIEIQVFTKDMFRCFKKNEMGEEGGALNDLTDHKLNEVLDATVQQSLEYY